MGNCIVEDATGRIVCVRDLILTIDPVGFPGSCFGLGEGNTGRFTSRERTYEPENPKQ